MNLSDLGYTNQTVYIAFRLITEDGFKLYLDDIHVWKNDASELTDLVSTKVLCYPNPGSDVINIHLEGEFQYCEVQDVSGKTIVSSKEKTFSIKDLPSGIYQLKVFQNGYSTMLRFVKI